MQLLILLLFPLTLLAGPVTCPDHHSSCKYLSLHNPTLQVDEFEYYATYTYTTPAHLIAHGYVEFKLFNDMLNTETVCKAYSSWLQHFYYGVVWYTCEDETSMFRYSFITGNLELNTTWTCPGRRPATFNGTAVQDMDPTCVEENYKNPNFPEGEGYSWKHVTCTTPLTTIVPEVVRL